MGEYSEANIKFHQAIIGLSKCPLIVEITNGLFFSYARHSAAHHFRAGSGPALDRRSQGDRGGRWRRAIPTLPSGCAEHTLRLRDHLERFVRAG